MTKKKIVLLGVCIFLFVVIFAPRQADIYLREWVPESDANYYKTPTIFFGINNYFHDKELEFVSWSDDFQIVGEKQLLEKPSQLSHEEKFDILTSECKLLFQNHLSLCDAGGIFGTADICYLYYDKSRYEYCISVYDHTRISNEECKMLHEKYLERWEGILSKSFFIDFDRFADNNCKGRI